MSYPTGDRRNSRPFMMNCFPSLVKNLLPCAVMVGSAPAIVAQPAITAAPRKPFILSEIRLSLSTRK